MILLLDVSCSFSMWRNAKGFGDLHYLTIFAVSSCITLKSLETLEHLRAIFPLTRHGHPFDISSTSVAAAFGLRP